MAKIFPVSNQLTREWIFCMNCLAENASDGIFLRSNLLVSVFDDNKYDLRRSTCKVRGKVIQKNYGISKLKVTVRSRNFLSLQSRHF